MKEKVLRTQPRSGEAWGKLWKIQTPPKAKHLLWRICQDCLPTRLRLKNRFVQCPIDCPICTTETEEDWHIFLECEGSKEAWNVMGLEHIIQQRRQEVQNIKEFIFNLCCFESSQAARRAAVLIWHIWQNRNNQVWNNSKVSARQVGIKANQTWEEWSLVQGLIEEQPGTVSQHDNNTVQQHTAITPATQWLPPRPGILKCNVDASFYEAAGYTGWGWCLRDHRGRFILAGTNLTQGRLNTFEGEAMTLKEAIEEAMSKGFSHVIFESDSKNVVDAISFHLDKLARRNLVL
ncbi:unnamed protein product [Trifolium pratense]|uniref:Uncharacterized protein n=1 Tax=Trifolium pratense TaxID=57577 RepID=A0ACB0J9V4_TRIPR|nr:unnamed protein product [Trifolium pratense]